MKLNPLACLSYCFLPLCALASAGAQASPLMWYDNSLSYL